MSSGRVALLGDAAHPSLPFLAQGGAMAIEDAAVLAAEIARSPDDTEASLRNYEKARLARVRRVQDVARRNGRIYHAGGITRLARNLAMRRLGPDGMRDGYAWIYGWRLGPA
jgi:salicylate hydroxylase